MKNRFTSTASVSRLLAALLVSGLLAACGSNVKLNDTPVTDRTGTSGTTDAGTGTSAGTSTGVAPVVITEENMGQPPESVARVIYFDYDSFTVKPEYAATLEGHAKFLKADPKRRVVLQGHTDERGTREYNLALGQKRAEAVRRAMAVLGVSDAQQEPVSYGEEKPAVQGADEAAFAKNRRVEFTYR